jgi:hypothetical protein
MANITVQKKFEIPHLFEDQAIEGYISTSNTLEITLKDEDNPFVISIYDVEILEDDVNLKYIIFWEPYGPSTSFEADGITPVVESIPLSKIKSAKAKFLKYYKVNKYKSRREDFMFSFKTKNGSYDMRVSKYDFSCVLTRVNDKEKKKYYGYITDVITDEDGTEYALLEEYKAFRGVYSVDFTKIPVANIIGIFKYKVGITDFTPRSASTEESDENTESTKSESISDDE